jgi:prepilin-type processing-associated H-X9-DG protein
MRQLGIGWYTYSIENDDSLCSPNTDFNNDDIDDHWVADGPYDISNIIGGTERAIKDGVLAPYVSNTIGVYKCNSDATEMLRSYSISNTMGGYDCGCGNMTTPYSSWSQINEPSNRLAFIDADSSEPDWSERAWIAGGFWCLSEIDPATARWAVPSYNNITARHNGGTNFTYADMHCGYRRWRDERTLAIANWDFSSDNLGGDNKDLDFFLEVLKGPMD